MRESETGNRGSIGTIDDSEHCYRSARVHISSVHGETVNDVTVAVVFPRKIRTAISYGDKSVPTVVESTAGLEIIGRKINIGRLNKILSPFGGMLRKIFQIRRIGNLVRITARSGSAAVALRPG